MYSESSTYYLIFFFFSKHGLSLNSNFFYSKIQIKKKNNFLWESLIVLIFAQIKTALKKIK